MSPEIRLYHLLKVSLVILIIFSAISLGASERSQDNFVFYRGTYTDTGLIPILIEGDLDFKASYLTVAGWNRELDGRIRNLSFESEMQLGVHSGIMKHLEANGLLIARLGRPWNLPVSFAFGEGLSIASKEPDMEKYGPDIREYRFNSQATNPVLNYLMVEMAFTGLYDSKIIPVKPFIRIHHRSGIYGTYCPPICGSNFVTYGISLDL